MNTLPPPLRIANAAAVIDGPYGSVSRQAALSGTSRQALYRDAPRVVQAVDGSDHRRHLHDLSQDNDRLRAERDHLRRQLQQAVALDADRLACFAATAQAEGVSLPVARRLLLPLLQRRTPSVPQLGRWAQAAARKADALLSALDAVARPRVEQAAADEIFFGRRPCLMVVEQHSLCWLTGRLADDRGGATWAEELRRLPNLRQVTRDGGTGLARGVALVNQQRQAQGAAAIADQEDHFHTLREGRRALRQTQQRVCRAIDAAAAARQREQRKARRTGSRQGTAAVTARAERHAAAAVEAGAAVENAWATLTDALQLFTPTGELNTRARAGGIIAAALLALQGPAWAKTRRALTRP
jgi:ABC-type amino acid transport substrate-binding protein